MVLWRMLLIGSLIVGFPGMVQAEGPSKVEVAMAGGTIKTLAKAFIATANLDELKNNSIEKLKRMGPERFRQQYGKQYKVIKDLPLSLQKKYGFVENMPKEHLIRSIQSLDKKQIYEIIEAIPDRTIAREVKGYFAEDNKAVKDKNFAERVKMVWNDIVGDLARKPPDLKSKDSK